MWGKDKDYHTILRRKVWGTDREIFYSENTVHAQSLSAVLMQYLVNHSIFSENWKGQGHRLQCGQNNHNKVSQNFPVPKKNTILIQIKKDSSIVIILRILLVIEESFGTQVPSDAQFYFKI